MATSTYFDAACPEPWQVLGVSLKPFSLGHYIKLRRLGCAFVADETQEATLGDLLLGVAVCSMETTPDPALDPFWNWLNRVEPQGWFDRFTFRLRKWLFKKMVTPAELEMFALGRKFGRVDLSAKAKLFAEYIDQHSKPPAYWEGDGSGNSGRPSGAHWSQSVIYTLVSKCGYSQAEALNVPMTKALADFFKHAESEGSVRLMTIEERTALGI